MLYLHTGLSRRLFDALAADIESSAHTSRIVVVPKQLTLLTERMLFSALGLNGSFSLQIYGAQRLCDRIFEAAGSAAGTRIDDRGRAILVHQAVSRVSDRLTLYSGAEHRRGFVQRAADQLQTVRQAGLTPTMLRECAAEESGTSMMKLLDLASIQEAYEELIDGRFLDGEAEFDEAGLRAASAAFLTEAEVYFYGFDMMPPSLMQLICRIAAACEHTHLYLPLENDPDARDRACFEPMWDAIGRLTAYAELAGTHVERRLAEDDLGPEQAGGIRTLEKELFSLSPRPYTHNDRSVHLAEFTDVRSECLYAAAMVRRLVRTRGWHYSDIAILCSDPNAYAAQLHSAFSEYDIPLVLAEQRAAARHPTAECLLSALRAIELNWPEEDMAVLLGTGMCAITPDEAGLLTNWAIENGLRGRRWTVELRHYPGNERKERRRDIVEPLRARAMEPLLRLSGRLKRAKDLPGQLEAIFGFLTDIDAYGHSQRRMQALSRADLWEEAGEEGQVWNRIIGTMDQLCALTDGKKLPLRDLWELMSDALSMSVIRMLPQSGDAVYAQGANTVCRLRCRAMLVLGMADRSGSDQSGLLTPPQRKQLSRFTHAYLGPTDTDLARLSRFYLKCSLGSVTELLHISCPLAASDGSAQKRSMLFDQITALIPGLRVDAGVDSEPDSRRAMALKRMLLSSEAAATDGAACALAESDKNGRISDTGREALAALALRARRSERAAHDLAVLRTAVSTPVVADSLDSSVAAALYGTLRSISISRLESFANCPLQFFAEHGLKPTITEPYCFDAADEGLFLHRCAECFTQENRAMLSELEGPEAERRMAVIADRILDELAGDTAMGDTAVTLQERTHLKQIACFSARVIARQMYGSLFVNTDLERDIGTEADEARLELSDGCALIGRIDRIDSWENYLRVIDFKRGKKDFDPTRFYYGLQLQLMLYLAGARALKGGESAGVYYSIFSDGIVSCASTDPNEVEKERRKLYRLHGPFPSEKSIQEALTPDPDTIYGIRVKQDGDYMKGSTLASTLQYEHLTGHALRRAAEHIAGIRGGSCAAAPTRIDNDTPCTYCRMRGTVCMRDAKDATGARRLSKLSYDDMLRMIVPKPEGAPEPDEE